MTTAGEADGGGAKDSGDDSEALDLFEGFLTRYHDDGEGATGSRDFAVFCAEHPEHAPRFQRWWDQLVHSGEVTDTSGSERAETPVEGSQFGDYRILREIGRGSQGTVFLAEDTNLGRRVALKVLPAFRGAGRDKARRFAREAELASRLDHPGLCTVYDRGVLGGVAFLSMRYVEGATLAALLARARRQQEVGGAVAAVRVRGGDREERRAIHDLLECFEAAAGALDAAHQAGLIHRDVKPGNIVVDRDGGPVLLDFGLARDVDSDLLTITGDLLGTPAYMSPEQLAAHRIELDRRTDIFSLGATLYECLTQSRPFDAPTRNELYQQILFAEPTDPRKLNPAVSRDLAIVVLTALDKDRNRRYRSAAALAEDLRRVRKLLPIRARKAGPLLRFRRWVQRNPRLATGVIVLFTVLSMGLLVSQFYYRRAERFRNAFMQLADQGRLENAEAELRRLMPIGVDNLAAVEAWRSRFAEPLRARLIEHRRDLAALRARALPLAPGERERAWAERPEAARLLEAQREAALLEEVVGTTRRAITDKILEQRLAWVQKQTRRQDEARRAWRPYRFQSAEDAAVHAAMAQLVAELSEFCGPGGSLGRVDRQLEALRAEAGQLDARYAALGTAAEKIYGAKIPTQPDLLPLGASPEGLLEFAVLGTGTPPSRAQPGGPLAIGEGDAVVLVLVPGADFELGWGSYPRRMWERGSRTVQLDPFFIGKYELTRGQWARMAGVPADPNVMLLALDQEGVSYPMDSVSWVEADRVLGNWGLDLPTEAQWEYAALGGRRGPYSFRREELRERPLANLKDRAWLRAAERVDDRVRYDDDVALLAPVGKFPPNPFGVHEIHGNLAEWCREHFLAVQLRELPCDPGTGYHSVPANGERGIRGGSFLTWFDEGYATRREGRHERVEHVDVGIRPVRAMRPGFRR